MKRKDFSGRPTHCRALLPERRPDIFYPPEQSLDMYRMVQGAELAVIANADHFTTANQFDVAIEVLLSFMRRVAGPE